EGGSVVLQANTGVGLTYQWLNGTTAIAGASSASYTANQTGSYSVVVTNANGCSATSTATAVTVNTLPTIQVSSPDGLRLNPATQVLLQANSSGSLITWYKDGNMVGSGASLMVTSNGNYKAIATQQECSAESEVMAVTSNVSPTISFTTDAAEYTAIATILMSADASDSDGSIAIVEFYLDGIKVGETSIQPYSFELPNMSAGTYQLKAIAIDQEGAKSESTVVQVVVKDPIQTSVLEETMRTIELFPNPFRETSRIRLDGNGTYELFTIDNHLMESGQVNQEVEIGSALSSGVYLLKVRVGDQFKTYKLIKQ
nr:T9SS type A sorting domain-containing protein [Cytophagaceae bacterium]